MSDVLANAEEDDLWITLQIHPNIVAIADMKGLAGIVMIGGREPQEDTLEKAKKENVTIMLTKMPAFGLSGKLYAMGLSGTKDDAEGI
ncbi:MAG: serine kinase [Planctomycetes bacterium]|nr:serine kinase [Planctomycetota bacterium]